MAARAMGEIDQRLKLDYIDVADVVAEAFAQSHKTSIKITGNAEICTALVKAGVLGRVSDRSVFSVKPDWINPEAQWETVEADPDNDVRAIPRSKSGTWYRTRASALTLKHADIYALGHGPFEYGEIVDLENACGAFDAGAKPSVRFQTCDHAPSPETAALFMDKFRSALPLAGVAFAEIADGGMIFSNAHQALITLNATTIRFWNDALKRMAFKTVDKWGRECISWGEY
jgi:hypothetical protein